MTLPNRAREYIQTLSKKEIFTRVTICKALGCQEKSLTTVFKDLRSSGLIKLVDGNSKTMWKYRRCDDIKPVYSYSTKLSRLRAIKEMNLLDQFIYRPIIQYRTDINHSGSHAGSFEGVSHV